MRLHTIGKVNLYQLYQRVKKWKVLKHIIEKHKKQKKIKQKDYIVPSGFPLENE